MKYNSLMQQVTKSSNAEKLLVATTAYSAYCSKKTVKSLESVNTSIKQLYEITSDSNKELKKQTELSLQQTELSRQQVELNKLQVKIQQATLHQVNVGNKILQEQQNTLNKLLDKEENLERKSVLLANIKNCVFNIKLELKNIQETEMTNFEKYIISSMLLKSVEINGITTELVTEFSDKEYVNEVLVNLENYCKSNYNLLTSKEKKDSILISDILFSENENNLKILSNNIVDLNNIINNYKEDEFEDEAIAINGKIYDLSNNDFYNITKKLIGPSHQFFIDRGPIIKYEKDIEGFSYIILRILSLGFWFPHKKHSKSGFTIPNYTKDDRDEFIKIFKDINNSYYLKYKSIYEKYLNTKKKAEDMKENTIQNISTLKTTIRNQKKIKQTLLDKYSFLEKVF